MKNYNLVLQQKHAGTIELSLGMESILLNGTIFAHLLITRDRFSMHNALLQECVVKTDSDGISTIEIGDNRGTVSRNHLLGVLAPMHTDILSREESSVVFDGTESFITPPIRDSYELYTDLMQQYLINKEKCLDAFMFFRIGDFYEFFFDDAVHTAKVLNIQLTTRSSNGAAPMSGIPKNSLDAVINKLLEQGYKIAVCEQMEEAKEKQGKIVKREIIKMVTPGTIVSGSTLNQNSNNYIASLSCNNSMMGLAFCDISTGEFKTTYCEKDLNLILSELSSYNPSEVVIDNSIRFETKLYKNLKLQMKSAISYVDDGNDYSEFITSNISSMDNYPAIAKKASGLLYYYLYSTQKESLKCINKTSYYEMSQHMILDMNTRKGLELTPTKDNPRKETLSWILDRTETPMGSRMLKNEISKPLLDREKIQDRLDAVEYLVKSVKFLEDIKTELFPIQDLERLANKVLYGSANPKDLHRIKISLQRLPYLKEILKKTNTYLLKYIGDQINPLSTLVELLNKALSDEPSVVIKDGNVIKRGYDERLDKYRDACNNSEQWVKQYQEKLQQELGIPTLKIKNMASLGYYVEVPRKLSHLVPKTFTSIQVLTDRARYKTEELTRQEILLSEAEESIYDLEHSLFSGLREKVAECTEEILSSSNNLALLDLLCSFATISLRNNYVKPIISDNYYDLYIENGRHPVVEASYSYLSEYVSNDTIFTDEDRMLMITGPNMAGKSTYMRQVALISLMMHVGCFVPASYARIPLIDRIFTRIGASDDLYGGESTFMVEMKDVKNILDESTEKSLVIIDELGRGTSVQDGMALAQSVIEYLHHNKGCKTLISTHYHDLTKLEDSLNNMKNYYLDTKVTENKIVFPHKLLEGTAGHSYGIYCAQLAGVKSSVVKRAEALSELYAKDSSKVEKIDTSKEVSHYLEIKDLLNNFDENNSKPVEAIILIQNLKDIIKGYQ